MLKSVHFKIKKHWYDHFPVYIFFLLFTPLYVAKLSILPYSFHGDEANTALQALHLPELIGVGWYDLPLVSFVPHFLSMLVFGKTIVGDRMGSIVFGLGALPFFYLLVRDWYSRRVGTVATIFLGTSHMWIALSRLGIAYIQVGFLLIASTYFVWKMYKKQSIIYAVFAGASLGCSIYFYYAARIIPFIVLPIFIWMLIKKPHPKYFKQVCFVLVTAFLIMLPQILFFIRFPESFGSRTKEVFILSSDQSVKDFRDSEYHTSNTFSILTGQIQRAFSVQDGDTGGQYGYKGLLLDGVSILLFVLGLCTGFRLGKKKYVFLLYWLGLTFVGGVMLTINPIFIPRFVVGIPVVVLFCALGFEQMFVLFTRRQKVQHIVAILVVLFIVFWNLTTYFIWYPQQERKNIAGDRNAYASRAIATYLQKNPTHIAIFLTPPELYADFAPLVFLVPKIQKVSIPNASIYHMPSPCPRNVIYILYPSESEILQHLQSLCPQGNVRAVADTEGTIFFYSFVL